MAAREKGKGTVTSLSSMFPAEEARKAAELVNDKILENRKELDNLRRFVADNTNLINLVQCLPDQLHHHIQVPFGKAAFFPGRLVHTNEFLVLLGEGYFADRTAKQTVDILKRRGQTLESQVGSVKAVIEDLKAEASFFDRTAAEAVEGLVEIREECSDDEDSGGSPKKADAPSVSEIGSSSAGVVDDEEYARIMSRLDELEKEELEEEDIEEDEDDANLVNHKTNQGHLEDHHHAKELSDSISQTSDADKLIRGNLSLQELQPGHKDESSRSKDVLQNYVGRSMEEDYVPSVMKSSVPSEVSVPAPKPDAGNRLSRPATDSLKAFTGSIIERTDNLQIFPDKDTIDPPSNPQPSKPVSRFKMQRRGF